MCFNAVREILINDPHNWAEYEDQIRLKVKEISKGDIGYYTVMHDVLQMFGIDI